MCSKAGLCLAASCCALTLVMVCAGAYAQDGAVKKAKTNRNPTTDTQRLDCPGGDQTKRSKDPNTKNCPDLTLVDNGSSVGPSAAPGQGPGSGAGPGPGQGPGPGAGPGAAPGPDGLPPPPFGMIVPSKSFNLGPPLGGPAAIGNINPIFVMPQGMVGALKPDQILIGFGDLAKPRPAPDGFNHVGTEIYTMGGSFGRNRETIQTGQSKNNFSTYFAGSRIQDPSWRDNTDSKQYEFYGDLGWRNETSNLHLSFSGQDLKSSGNGLTPAEMLAKDRSSSFIAPSGDTDRRWKIQLSGEHETDTGWDLNGKTYIGHVSRTKHWADGETPQSCTDNAATLCNMMGSPYLTLSGDRFPLYSSSYRYASLTNYSEDAYTYGGSLEGRNSGTVFGRANDFVIGAAFDGSTTSGTVSRSLGEYTSDYVYTNDQGVYQTTSADLRALYFSLYAADQLAVTDRLTVGSALRFNVSDLNRYNGSATNVTYDYDLNMHKTYYSVDPSIGLTYKFNSDLVGYAGYNRESRAPTSFGTMCSNLASTCAFPNFPIADEPLLQTHSDNFEAGLRGQNTVLGDATLSWNVRLFSQMTSDTYWLVLRETRPMFSNVGDSWRRGVRFNAALETGPWTIGLDYILQKSTFEEEFTEFSSDNPSADAMGNITVPKGSEMPNIPNQILNVSVDYAVNDRLKIGALGTGVAGSYAQFDENNTLKKSDPYALLSLNASYKLSDNAEIFGLITNVFDTKYNAMAALIKVNSIPSLGLTNSLGYIPGDGRAFYAGLRVTF
ncbi:TonB-dependent receptor domain-containing protein [Agrobacterium vitis]|uniref:TonB-dependent receptor domain-containing protein n=1 Tax=Agrobacterium vitis TaxID=373 RepID=UPI003D2E576D